MKVAQSRNGLAPTGVVDKATIMALNVPASARLRQLQTNLVRIESLAAPTKGRYVVVNIPAAQIEAVENDQVVSRHAGVVGKVDRPTPILQSYIHEINFNKEWILPPTVIKEDLVPKARSGAKGYEVFRRYGIDVYTDYNAYAKGQKLDPATVNWSSPAREQPVLRAKARRRKSARLPEDQLLQSLLRLYARHAVQERLRAQCPRRKLRLRACAEYPATGGVAASGRWLGSDARQRDEAVRRDAERAPSRARVKLYFAYVTSWATPDGQAHFRRDLYNRDGVGATATAY